MHALVQQRSVRSPRHRRRPSSRAHRTRWILRRTLAAALGVAIVSLVAPLTATDAAAFAPMRSGDIVLSLYSLGQVNEYTPTGTFVQHLLTTPGDEPTGTAFDGAGNLYVATFGNNRILKVTAASGGVSVFSDDTTLGDGTVFDSPESIAFGPGYTTMYVSDANRFDTGGGIHVLDPATGAGTGFYPLPTSTGFLGSGESDWLALSPSSTLYMTNESPAQGVMAVDETSGDILTPSFVGTLPSVGYAMSFLPNGDLWLSMTTQLVEYSPAGAVLKTVTNSTFSLLFGSAFNPLFTTLYAANNAPTGKIFTYNLTGTLVHTFSVTTTVTGISVAGTVIVPTHGPLAVTTTSLPGTAVGESYTTGLSAVGGTPPYTWSVSAGVVPTGTALDASTGSISGTPSIAGTYAFTATVTDSASPPASASAQLSVAVQASGAPQTWPVAKNGTGMIHSPHIGFVLVGNWWCAMTTGVAAASLCQKAKKSTNCATCASEGAGLVSSMASLVSKDYGARSTYREQLASWYCIPALDCAETGFVQRYYDGQLFYGPISTKTATKHTGSTLNSVAGSFGIQSQADASDTVFVFLYAPNLYDTSCKGKTRDVNGTTVGKKGQYGFVFANVYLEDAQHECNGPQGTVVNGDLNQQSPDPITPEQFATFAASHEIDEAVTSPGVSGFVVPSVGGQIADPCTSRSLAGTTLGYGTEPYWNFTRDQYGTVVAAFDQFSFSTGGGACYPDVSTSVPPG